MSLDALPSSTADSSARLAQPLATASFVASHEEDAFVPFVASHEKPDNTANICGSLGVGQKSKTVKHDGLKFRVRLNDRGHRVMLLTTEGDRRAEPYLVSLRQDEWATVENDTAAFVAKVKEKLRARIEKADAEDMPKLETLLTTIEEKSR